MNSDLGGGRSPSNVTVSVVIPVFNRAHSVAASLDSALDQNCPDGSMQVIVVDDGSSDDLDGVLRAYRERVVCIRHERNAGAAAARNTGVAAAQGDYVAFLDSDDQWLPGKLARQLRSMRENDWKASCTGYWLARPGTTDIVSPDIESGALGLSDLVAGCFVSPGSTLMFLRAVFDEVGPLDTSLGRLEDWDWLLRYTRGHKLGFISAPLARIHPASAPDPAVVIPAIDVLRRKHADGLTGRERRHFEAALDFETAAAFCRRGEWTRGIPPLVRSWLRSPLSHPSLKAALHNRFR